MASNSPQAYTRSSSWSTLSPNSDFYYRPSGEIISGSYRIVSVLPGRYEDPIQCRLREVSLRDTSPRFIALSYCWNDSRGGENIWCDGRPLRITTNLFAALRNARATNAVMELWIDQICIDQGNIIDRNDQVSKMGAIFRAASGVIVWLGQEGPGTAVAMELPHRIRKFWPSVFENHNELLDPSKTPPDCPRWGEGAWAAFLLLLRRPWFRRLWIIQEIACAKDIIVTCGKATAFWDDFVRLVKVVEARSSVSTTHMLGSKTAAHHIAFMQQLRIITEQGTKQAVKDYANEESLAPYVLTMAKDCEATDHRDKLFAFHHLVRLWNRPDYAMDIDMLYKLFAVQYLQRIAYAISEFSCDEAILFRRQLEFVYSGGLCNQSLELPSWCPDWSVPWLATPLWHENDLYRAGGTDVKEITPLADIDAAGKRHRFRLPLTVKQFDRVITAGTEGLKIMSGDVHDVHSVPAALRAWLFQSMSLLHNHRNRRNPYPDQHVAVARTITVDQSHGKRVSSEDAVKLYDKLLEALRESDGEERPDPRHGHYETDQFCYSIANFLRGRVFFITENGYVGLAREGLAWGDSIAVIRGGPIPIAMRPTVSTGPQSQEYRLLCEVFVLGIMDGEAWQNQAVSAEEIMLI